MTAAVPDHARTMKALTVKQPYAGAIIEGWKPIENRSWLPSERQLKIGDRFAIHASASPGTGPEFSRARDGVAVSALLAAPYVWACTSAHGVILGTVELAGFVDSNDDAAMPEGGSNWWVGPLGWILRAPRKLNAPISAKGRLGLWELPPDIAAVMP